MNIGDSGETCQLVVNQVKQVIVGKEQVLEKVMLAVLANSHILFEDYPGLAKTLMARSFAMSMGCEFSRIQFTPDLLPADITGTYIYNVKTSDFELRRGPVFTNVLLADEITELLRRPRQLYSRRCRNGKLPWMEKLIPSQTRSS